MKTNPLRTFAVAALLNFSILTLAVPALAQVRLSVDIGVPPPPPVYESYEPARPGYVLLPGYWFWDGHQHRWAAHRWAEERPGQHWSPERWEQRGKKNHFEPGRWEKDRRDDRGGRPGRENQGNQGNGHGYDRR